jgi:hypothetical protein
MEGTVSRTSDGVTELDRIASRRQLATIDMALTVRMPLCLASDPHATGWKITEFGVAMLFLQITFLASEYVIPSLVDGNPGKGNRDISWDNWVS